MPRTLGAAVVALGAFVLVLVASVATAEDDTDRRVAGVSLDGTSYQESLEGPLFADDVSWGPGDLRVRRFWVRGPARAGDLTISLDPGAAEDLVGSGRLKILARAGDLPWRPVRPGTAVLLTDAPAGDGVPVSVRVTLSARVPEEVRLHGSDVALTVEVGGARVLGAAPAADSPPSAGSGEAVTWWVVPLGILALAGGALLHGRRELAGPLR